MLSRDELIQSISLIPDPRSLKWEYKVILDTLQECNPCPPKILLEAINSKYESTPSLFTYNSLYNNLQSLLSLNAVQYNVLRKEYSISSEYITTRVQYLPISTYSVALFTISVIGLLVAVYKNYMVSTALLVVLVGLLYLLGQHLGTEFKLK